MNVEVLIEFYYAYGVISHLVRLGFHLTENVQIDLKKDTHGENGTLFLDHRVKLPKFGQGHQFTKR